MLAKRIIPCLDVTGGRVVKGVNFTELRDAGDPVEIARRYDGQGADGLVPGNGLRGMRERVQQCGGTLDIQTRRGEGFRLRLSIPVSTPARPAIEGALP